MIPVIYNSTETVFTNKGIGTLKDCVSCVVIEERNGAYECEFSYPIDGQFYEEISPDRIIKAKPNEMSDPQLFRIYRISKPINGIVSVYCQHISYDLNTNPVSPFNIEKNALATLTDILSHCEYQHRFTATSTLSSSTTAKFKVKIPTAAKALLGGVEGSVLDLFGGEYEFDNFQIKLHAARGQDNGVTIYYGKNLTDIKAETNIENTYTSIYPYAVNSENDTTYTLQQKIVTTQNASNFGEPRTLCKDFSEKFDFTKESYSDQKLLNLTNQYISSSGVDDIKQNIKISFVQLWQTEEYKNVALLERVRLCDTVTVKYQKLGVSVKAKVIKTEYDSLLEKYISITLGDAKSTLGDTLAKANSDLQRMQETVPNKSAMQAAIDHATDLITGQEGGNVVLNCVSGTKKPFEILIMNTDDIQTATKVWRWNLGGLGYSNSGYTGPYGTAITMDGQIVANYVATGTLNAGIIKAGILQDESNINYWNMVTGEFKLSDGTNDAVKFTNGQLTIDANFIKSGAINANLITTGKIQDANNYNYWNLNTGELKISAAQAKIDNQTVSNYVSNAANSVLTQTNVFNALTNNGTLQGLFMATDPNDGRQKLYINATYIKSGIINADLIQAGTMSANRVRAGAIVSQNAKTTFDLDSGVITLNQEWNHQDIGNISLWSGGMILHDPSDNYIGGLNIAQVTHAPSGSVWYESHLEVNQAQIGELSVSKEVNNLNVGVLSASTRLETKALQAINLFSNQISTPNAVVGSLSIQGNNPTIYFDGLPLSWVDTTINGTSYKLLGYSTGGTTPVSVEVSLNTTYYDVDQTSGVFKGRFGLYTVTDTSTGKTYKIAAYSRVNENTNATQSIEGVSYRRNTLYLQIKGYNALLRLNENDYQTKNPNATKFSYSSGNTKYILSPLTLNFGDFKGVYFGYKDTN